MGSSKQPPPPDYVGAAKEQGEQNILAAQNTAALNRPDQIDRNGTQTWSLKEGADPKNPQPGDWVVTNKLSDTQEGLAGMQDQISSQFGGLGLQAMNGLQGTIGTKFDASGVPRAEVLTNRGINAFGKMPGVPAHLLSPEVNQNRAELSNEGLHAFGSVDPTTEASRQRITDALYSRQTAMLDPRAEQQRSDLTSRLAAQGITEGSEAFDRATGNQQRAEADEYLRARESAILAGGAEDSRIGAQNMDVANLANRVRGQEFDERGQIVNNRNSNIDTIFGQGLARAGFNNGVYDTEFDQGMRVYDKNAATRAQQFGENQAVNAANNTLHGNALQEAIQQRQMGLNEANALRSGAQVSAPQFQPYGGAGNVQGTDIMGATRNQFDANLGIVNSDNAQRSSNVQSGVGAAATAASMYLAYAY